VSARGAARIAAAHPPPPRPRRSYERNGMLKMLVRDM
jgi:hypothetical protein